MLLRAAIALAAVGFLGLAPNGARAALVYDLTIDHCTGGCSTGGVTPFATVTISQSGGVDTFTVVTNSPTYVFNGNGNGFDAFAFSLASGTGQTITLSAAMLAAGFSVDLSLPQHQDGFGDYTYGIALTNAGTGATSLSFTLTDPNPLTTASFSFGTGGSGDALFTADILSLNGLTGVVGGGIASAVPEPSTWAMMILGFAGIGFMAYRRRSRTAMLRVA
jgi:hypothetical protein